MGDRLKGKVAIVTGAGTMPGPDDRPPIGNGKACAMLFAREGANVFAVDLRADAAEETKAMIQAEGGVCSSFSADISRPEACRAIAEECLRTYGRIDILHNNVGIGTSKAGDVLEENEEEWDLVMNVNAKGLFQICRAILPQMLNQQKGAILNISSLSAVLYRKKMLIYSVSKAAVNAFTRSLAAQFADKGIRVNCIMPGAIDSPPIYKEILPLYGGDIEKMRKDRNESVPMKHMGEPWDIAHASLFLVSDEAKFITGQVLAVDGGQLVVGI